MTSLLSHRLNLGCQWYDPTRRRDVTDERAGLAGRAIRGAPNPPAGGCLPHARLADRSRRRPAGGVDPPQPLGYGEGRKPWRLADDNRRARVPEHAALPQGAG